MVWRTKIALFLIIVCIVVINIEDIGKGFSSVSKERLNVERYVWPVPAQTEVAKYYGEEYSGIDIEKDGEAVEVVAAQSGTVKVAKGKVCKHIGNSNEYCCESNGMGNYVIIEGENGLQSKYLHLKYDSVVVREGDYVVAGTIIGFMGNSGRSSRQHLFFQLGYSSTNTENVNPDKIKYDCAEISTTDKEGKWQLKKEVSLRSCVGTTNEVLVNIPKNKKVTVERIVKKDGELWGKIKYKKEIGWGNLKDAKFLEGIVVKKKVDIVDKNKDKKVFKIRFKTLGGKMDFDVMNFYEDEKIKNLDVPEKSGYIFDGWYKDRTFTKKVNEGDIMTEDLVVYAKWTQ